MGGRASVRGDDAAGLLCAPAVIDYPIDYPENRRL